MLCISCNSPIYGSSDRCSQCGTLASPYTMTPALNQQPAIPPGVVPPPVNDHLALALITMLVACMPLGIVALYYSSQVGPRRNVGDFPGAMIAAKKAKQWSLAGIFGALGCYVLMFGFVIFAALFG